MARINEDAIVELTNHIAFKYQPRLKSLDKGLPILGAIPRPVSSEYGSHPSMLFDAFLGNPYEESSADDANAGQQPPASAPTIPPAHPENSKRVIVVASNK
jgi:hypothetical protein